MPIEYREHITRKMVCRERSKLFVFGDNMARWGLGGQARVMRGEKNSVGIITKRSPYEYLSDGDLAKWRALSEPDFARIETAAKEGRAIIIPWAGIGTGRAELRCRAPVIWDEMTARFKLITRLANEGATATMGS